MQTLIAGVRMYGGNVTIFNAPVIMQHLDHRRRAIGGTGRVRNDTIIFRKDSVIHAHYDRFNVVSIWRSRQHYFLRASIQMQGCGWNIKKFTGRFDNNIRIVSAPV